MKAKRILAIVLVIVLTLNIGVFALADEGNAQPFKKYVVIGDSIPSFHASDLPDTWDNKDFRTNSFPNLVAEHYGIPNGYAVTWGAWRPQELRIILEDDYYGDTYSSEWGPSFGGYNINRMKSDAPRYRSEIASADLITITLGGNTLMAYSLYVVDRALEKHTAGTELEKAAMAVINEAKEKNSENEALLTVLEFISTMQDVSALVTTILREMPIEILRFAESWDLMIKDIRAINPGAEIVCTSIYNAFGNWIKFMLTDIGELADVVAVLGNAISQPMVDAINAHMSCLSSEKNEYTYVDITGIDLTNSADGSHPGGVGHKYIADQVIAAIDKLICTHADTHIENAKAATKFSLGYSGDTVCDDCGKTVQKGCVTLYKCPHENTAVVGAVSPTHFTMGYTGNTVCTDCGKVMQLGQVTPSKLFAR